MKRYYYNRQLGVWQRDRTTIAAIPLGNEINRKLFELFSESCDTPLYSRKIQEIVKNYQAGYHFDPRRLNLLGGFHVPYHAKVLELGCGYGTITRQLGETGAMVHALERDHGAAQIAALRCRDLDNVNVVVDTLEEFSPDKKFSLAVMFGVLEYANTFLSTKNAPLKCLSLINQMLEEDGTLVLAIENKLGLKYLNGHTEDHIHKPFWGIQNLYTENQALTWGKAELEQLLKEAGFSSLEFYYPFPDYKLPEVIISDQGAKSPAFLASNLIQRTLSKSYNYKPALMFDEALVFEQLEKNGILLHFANSFLVFAHKSKKHEQFSEKWYAKIFSQTTEPNNTLETTFSAKGYRVISKSSTDHFNERMLEGLTLKEISGSTGSTLNYQTTFQRLLVAKRAVSDIASWAMKWTEYLVQHSDESAPGFTLSSKIPGWLLECTPRNIYQNSQGAIRYEFCSWYINEEIKASWVFIRGLAHSIYMSPFKGQLQGMLYKEAIREIAMQISYELSENDFLEAARKEEELQFRRAAVFVSINNPPDLGKLLRSKIEDSQGSVTQLQNQLNMSKEDLARLKEKLDEANKLLKEQSKELRETSKAHKKLKIEICKYKKSAD